MASATFAAWRLDGGIIIEIKSCENSEAIIIFSSKKVKSLNRSLINEAGELNPVIQLKGSFQKSKQTANRKQRLSVTLRWRQKAQWATVGQRSGNSIDVVMG